MILKLVKLESNSLNMMYNNKHVTSKELKRLSAKKNYCKIKTS